MTTYDDNSTTSYAIRGAFAFALGASLLILDGRAPKVARWGIGLVTAYVIVRQLRQQAKQ
ncbi:hypothetical protein ACFSUS_24040 [Spirosoma soli]|uniref:Uncharacterized protein n=1 Tax=Spirosoma soli TaxID=1770529 RepID=A0ABW5M9P3_9BACT